MLFIWSSYFLFLVLYPRNLYFNSSNFSSRMWILVVQLPRHFANFIRLNNEGDQLFVSVLGPPISDSNCLSLAVTIPWATALHIAVLTTSQLFLSLGKYSFTIESKLSPSNGFLPRFLLCSSTIFTISPVSKSILHFRALISWFPFYINSEINILWIL